jgi:hypothetical protein
VLRLPPQCKSGAAQDDGGRSTALPRKRKQPKGVFSTPFWALGTPAFDLFVNQPDKPGSARVGSADPVAFAARRRARKFCYEY